MKSQQVNMWNELPPVVSHFCATFDYVVSLSDGSQAQKSLALLFF